MGTPAPCKALCRTAGRSRLQWAHRHVQGQDRQVHVRAAPALQVRTGGLPSTWLEAAEVGGDPVHESHWSGAEGASSLSAPLNGGSMASIKQPGFLGGGSGE